MANPWAQVGSGAIAWEMAKLGIEAPPSSTTERILARAGVPKRRSHPEKYVPKGTPYPAHPVLLRPNAWQEADLVGPRHLEGAIPFYALNASDLGRRKVAIEILPSKQEREVAGGLVRIWSRLGIPGVAKFDNGPAFQGSGGHLALAVRLAVCVGVRVRFIPFSEPWRNPVIEHFNDVFDKRFFRTQRFHGLDELKGQAGVFEAFHNSHHRYSALKRATPEERERKLAFTPRLLDPGTVVPTELPRRGLVEFVRLIREVGADELGALQPVAVAVPRNQSGGHLERSEDEVHGNLDLVVEEQKDGNDELRHVAERGVQKVDARHGRPASWSVAFPTSPASGRIPPAEVRKISTSWWSTKSDTIETGREHVQAWFHAR